MVGLVKYGWALGVIITSVSLLSSLCWSTGV